MAVKHVASQTPEKKQTHEGVEYTVRPCPNYITEHEQPNGHVWHSHVKEQACYCDGKKRTPAEYTAVTGNGTGGTWSGGTYKPKQKKNYVTSTRADGRPWREDYTIPMTVTEARAIAYDMHAEDKDKSGEPYHLHLAAVEAGVKVLAGPDATEERIAALFHDAVEDWHTTYEHLRDLGCTEHTITMIEAVSKRSSEEQNVYLARIKAAGAGAMRVKVADILHNTRHDRMESVKKAKGIHTHDRLLKKYRPALASLMLELSLIVDEDEQKKIATKPQGTAGGYTSTTYGGSSKAGKFDTPVKSMLVGDWPTAWQAPVVHIEHLDGKSIVTLANGEIREETWKYSGAKSDRKLPVYIYATWSTTLSVKPYEKATEEQITDYINVIEATREAKQKPVSTYAATGEDDLSGFWDDESGVWAGL